MNSYFAGRWHARLLHRGEVTNDDALYYGKIAIKSFYFTCCFGAFGLPRWSNGAGIRRSPQPLVRTQMKSLRK